MNKNTKTVLIVLAVAIGLCVVGGAAAIGGLGLMAERFKDNVTTDQKKVQEMANGFINYELPDGYTESMGMDLLVYKMVMISRDDSDDINGLAPMILLAHFNESQGMTPEEMSEQMQKSLEQQSGNQGTQLKKMETRDVTINGQETTLTINEGTTSSGRVLRQWVTTCPGKSGVVMILIQGEPENWDDDVLNKFLASISTDK